MTAPAAGARSTSSFAPGRPAACPPRRRRRAAAAIATAVVLAVTAGCGVSADREPRLLAADDLPSDLLETADEPDVPTVADEMGQPAVVYLVDQRGLLVPVTRVLPEPGNDAQRLQALLRPLDPAERARGLTTSIAADTRLLGVDGPTGGVLTVDLSDDLLALEGQAQRRALAQVVYTATEIEGVDRVRIEFDGVRSELPRGSGEISSGSLSRTDYERYAPSPG